MPWVKLKIHAWLGRDFNGTSSSFQDLSISVSAVESMQQVISRLAKENENFRRAIFEEKANRLREDILVILNGRIINLDKLSEVVLMENDEIIFLPYLAGG